MKLITTPQLLSKLRILLFCFGITSDNAEGATPHSLFWVIPGVKGHVVLELEIGLQHSKHALQVNHNSTIRKHMRKFTLFSSMNLELL